MCYEPMTGVHKSIRKKRKEEEEEKEEECITS